MKVTFWKMCATVNGVQITFSGSTRSECSKKAGSEIMRKADSIFYEKVEKEVDLDED